MKPNLSIFTFSLGRDLYLKRLIDSIASNNSPEILSDIEHHICFQGVPPSEEVLAYIRHHYKWVRFHLHFWEKNYGTGEGINKILPSLSSDLILKLDDDAKLVSNDFFHNAFIINDLLDGKSNFSPFPVGLINNFGGPRGITHNTTYSPLTDTFYTLRKVSHIGGFARFSPAHIIKNCNFPDDLNESSSGNEDGILSNYCNNNGIEMFYLENSLIVEHQESTLGQHARFGERYFKKRF